MPHHLIRARVEDFEKWKPVFDEFDDHRTRLGQKSARVFQVAENPNQVVILQEWETLEGARSFYASETYKQAIQRAGVVGDPEMVVLDEAT